MIKLFIKAFLHKNLTNFFYKHISEKKNNFIAVYMYYCVRKINLILATFYIKVVIVILKLPQIPSHKLLVNKRPTNLDGHPSTIVHR